MNTPRVRRVARALFALGLLATLAWWVDPRRLAQALGGADRAWLGCAFALSTLANACSALRWRSIARWLGVDVPPLWALRRYFEGVALNAALPGAVVGGDLYRAHALTRQRLPIAEAAVSVLVDRLGGMWVLVALGLAAAAWGLAAGGLHVKLQASGVPTWSAAGPAVAALLMLALPLVLLLHASSKPALPFTAADRWPRRLRALAARPNVIAEYTRQWLWSLAVQVLSIGALAAGGLALGVALPWWEMVVGAVPTFLLAALPVGFGGWGTREAAAVAAFGALGVPAASAVAMGLLYGAWALCQSLLGVASWLVGRLATAPAARVSRRTDLPP